MNLQLSKGILKQKMTLKTYYGPPKIFPYYNKWFYNKRRTLNLIILKEVFFSLSDPKLFSKSFGRQYEQSL